MGNISEFKARFQGGARPSLFEVNIPSFGDAGRFFCKGAQIPSPVVGGPIEVRYQGFPLKVAGDLTYDAWTVTVIQDIDWAIRDALDAWVKRIYDPTTGVHGNFNDYVEDIRVSQMGPDGATPIKTYVLRDSWLQTYDPIDLNFDSIDTVEEYSVTFYYQYFETE